jgi:prolyl-tRNA editing enzyme YbaK/EbsC (Cys-tRNA(Pro) deacylase)
MKKPSSVERVRQALQQAGHDDTILTFPEGTRSAADAAAAIGCEIAQIAKSIIFRAGDAPVLVIASGVNRVDEKKVADLIGQELQSANGRWVREATGFAIGGVAPVAHSSPITTLIDEDLLALSPVWAAAGSPQHVFRSEAEALLQLTSGRVANIKTD